MPWVDKNKCTGCGLCINQCPVNAISLKEGKAVINMDECIRCGKCHDVCPQKAVRHDSELVSLVIEENVKKVKALMKHFKTSREKNDFLKRMIKYYNNKIKVSDGTIEKVKEVLDGKD